MRSNVVVIGSSRLIDANRRPVGESTHRVRLCATASRLSRENAGADGDGTGTSHREVLIEGAHLPSAQHFCANCKPELISPQFALRSPMGLFGARFSLETDCYHRSYDNSAPAKRVYNWPKSNAIITGVIRRSSVFCIERYNFF